MSLFTLDHVVSYQDMNDIKKLWAATSRPADITEGEVWLDISSTPFQLKHFNGTNDDVIGETGIAILQKLLTVHGPGSGLDADKLDGEHGVDFHDAAKLTGTVQQAQLSASDILTLLKTVDGSGSGLNADQLRGNKICAGSLYASPQGKVVYFDEAFSIAPYVAFGPHEPYNVWYSSITTTGLKVHSDPAQTTHWICYGAD